MLHYSVNRPMGALVGESDLTTMIPWLQRYSRMLEDRVRLHWAVRAFLWVVTVPTNKVKSKREQYRTPPEAGSIIVKDELETWEPVSPLLRGSDASHDLRAVRHMIDAGSGYPPHWRGEPAESNLATATAMQAPTERHLIRRQKYFSYMLQDIVFNAYLRAVQVGKARKIAEDDYEQLFIVSAPDVSRTDNEALARASRDVATAFDTLSNNLVLKDRPVLAKLLMRMIFKFAGEPQNDEVLNQLLAEMPNNAPEDGGSSEEED
jgi:AcrR family transcriptional regulator